MLPTPSTSHVCFDRVYEPAEDSFLLLDTLSSASETEFLCNRFANNDANAPKGCPLILEVGVGSGVVLAFVAANAAKILGRDDVLTLGTDINRFACQDASRTVQTALEQQSKSVLLDVVNGDLTTAIKPHTVDVLIFNPPYVPAELPDFARHDDYNALATGTSSTSFEQDSYLLELSYAGGEDGMVITNRLLDQIPDVLSYGTGVAYVLLCAQNKPEEVKARIRSWDIGWKAETVGTSGKKAGWEKLQILRIWRDAATDAA